MSRSNKSLELLVLNKEDQEKYTNLFLEKVYSIMEYQEGYRRSIKKLNTKFNNHSLNLQTNKLRFNQNININIYHNYFIDEHISISPKKHRKTRLLISFNGIHDFFYRGRIIEEVIHKYDIETEDQLNKLLNKLDEMLLILI